ncbi:MAG: hypothetical protein RL684_2671 [Pseudomonadota bacterium]
MSAAALFTKLNLGAHVAIHVLGAPPGFLALARSLPGVRVQATLGAAATTTFAIAFASTQAGLDTVSRQLVKAAKDDAILWVAYPKGTSKRFKCEFNRDSGWDVLAAAGYETVRQVAIDEDWSALRFRKSEFVGKGNLKRAAARK